MVHSCDFCAPTAHGGVTGLIDSETEMSSGSGKIGVSVGAKTGKQKQAKR